MKHAHSILITSALALFISACSQPEDVKPSVLAPQFGTADKDTSIAVAGAPVGGSYTLSRQFGYVGNYDSYYYKVILSRYASSGSQLWTRDIDTLEESTDTSDYPALNAAGVGADSSGNAYVLSDKRQVFQDYATSATYKVTVQDASGQLKRSFSVGRVMWSFSDTEAVPDIAVDVGGSTYVSIQQATINSDNFSFSTANLIRKYSSAGSLVWERPSSVGVPTGVAVSSDGSVYVAGRSGLARYNSSGTLLWKKSGFYNGVAVSGSSIHAYNKNTVYRFSSRGQPQWSSFMGGLNGAIIQDLSGDGSGGVLVSGKYIAGTGNWNAFVRKVSAIGSSQWTSTYGTPAFDDAQGIVAINGREAYVTGTTLGALAHPNKGEEDGYVRKLGVAGKPIWTR